MSAPSKRTGKTITKIYKKKKKKKVVVSFGVDKVEISQDIYSDYYLYVGKELTSKEYQELLYRIKQDSLYGRCHLAPNPAVRMRGKHDHGAARRVLRVVGTAVPCSIPILTYRITIVAKPQ